MAFAMNMEGRILYLPLRLVKPGPTGRGRPTAMLQELSASIMEVGILQPLTVRKTGEFYTVVSGSRRLMAARMVGLGEVPCILLNVDESQAELISLTENLQREDLHYLDEAECLKRYLLSSGLTQAQAAKKLGRSQSAVANKVRLLGHGESVRELLRETGLPERHARELLRVPGEEARKQVLLEVAERSLSIAQTERYIDNYLENQQELINARLRRRETRQFLKKVAQETDILERKTPEPEQLVLPEFT